MRPTPDRPYTDRAWLAEHLRQERAEADLLGDIREALFGAQDGLVATLAVVSTVGGATNDRYPILVAGIASALAGVFSMAAGEYLSSKSQREIYVAQIAKEREEVHDSPGEAEAEVAYMLEEEGLSREVATHVASEFAKEPAVLLNTMVEKELGIPPVEGRNALQGALVMGAAFGLAAIVPIVAYLFIEPRRAFPVSLFLSAAALFGLGVVKSRWTMRGWLRSGAEIVLLAAFAGIAGFFFGSILPALLGVEAPAG
ncbi:MAG: VIT1/CCC1 transporter family protein [Chloroflexi bacterium]|nr:VIT1/CCC1 transporter family protein [Chloroflexota bacterium]